MTEQYLKCEGGSRFRPKPHHPVKCLIHGVETTWGKLDEIQKLCVREGIDTVPELRCLLLPEPTHQETA